MTPGARELAGTVLAVAGAAGLVLFAAGRTWQASAADRPAPLPPQLVTVSGGALAPLLPALALVALAGAGALLASRGGGRRAVAVLLLICGVVMATAMIAVWPQVDGDRVGWPVLSVLGCLVIGAAGVAAWLRSPGWPSMGSRYEAAASRAAKPAAQPGNGQLWDALDRGEDPTR
jgi:hypothetical protein